MQPIQRVIYIGFATAALASASMPAFSWTVWPNVDFEWYANVGKAPPAPSYSYEVMPAPRAGHIWVPGRYEWTGTRHAWVPGAWIEDDYQRQWVAHATSQERLALRDRDGNVIPLDPQAYPVDSARR